MAFVLSDRSASAIHGGPSGAESELKDARGRGAYIVPGAGIRAGQANPAMRGLDSGPGMSARLWDLLGSGGVRAGARGQSHANGSVQHGRGMKPQ